MDYKDTIGPLGLLKTYNCLIFVGKVCFYDSSKRHFYWEGVFFIIDLDVDISMSMLRSN